MPELPNQRHEAFARLLADGMSRMCAYRQVYGATDNHVATNSGSKLAQRTAVAARVTELQAQGAQEAVWALSERLEYLRDVAMTPYGAVDPSSPLCVGTRLKPHGVEYQTPDKLAAVALYSRLVGDFEHPPAPPLRNPVVDFVSGIRTGAILPPLREPGDPPQDSFEPTYPSATMSAGSLAGYEPSSARPASYPAFFLEHSHGLPPVELRPAFDAPLPWEGTLDDAAPPLPHFAPLLPSAGTPLPNPRHERLAQYIAQGESQSAAASKVYGLAPESAKVTCSRLVKDPVIAARIAELRAQSAASVGWTRPQRLLYLKRFVLTPLQDITEASWFCQGLCRNPRGPSVRIPSKLKAIALYTRLVGPN